MASSGRKPVSHEFETDYLDYILKGEISVHRDTVGDPTVINGTQEVFLFHVESLHVFDGETEITEKYLLDPRSYENLKYYFVESFKLEHYDC